MLIYYLRKYFENISALSVADMRTTLRSGRLGNKSLRMIMRKSDCKSRSCISSRMMCVVLFNSLGTKAKMFYTGCQIKFEKEGKDIYFKTNYFLYEDCPPIKLHIKLYQFNSWCVQRPTPGKTPKTLLVCIRPTVTLDGSVYPTHGGPKQPIFHGSS